MDLDILPITCLHHHRGMLQKLEFIRINLGSLEGVLKVQDRAYQTFLHENAESFISKMKLSSSSCYGVLDEDRLIAYGISFPWLINQDVMLNSSLKRMPGKPDLMYIHDIAVDPDYQGLGLGEGLFLRILNDSLDLGVNQLVLVAVQGSQRFWAKFGFIEAEHDVDGYGSGAVKMVLNL
jgi:ribosomal protein S18 acetylase RimI-like enzyme